MVNDCVCIKMNFVGWIAALQRDFESELLQGGKGVSLENTRDWIARTTPTSVKRSSTGALLPVTHTVV